MLDEQLREAMDQAIAARQLLGIERAIGIAEGIQRAQAERVAEGLHGSPEMEWLRSDRGRVVIHTKPFGADLTAARFIVVAAPTQELLGIAAVTEVHDDGRAAMAVIERSNDRFWLALEERNPADMSVPAGIELRPYVASAHVSDAASDERQEGTSESGS